jgi:hypothetical protein
MSINAAEVQAVDWIDLTRSWAGNDSGAEFVDQACSTLGRLLEQQNSDEANRE